ncbi:MAG: superoxide dismutase family protein [Terriglobales bacterium]|jgi:Cu-Zn family superoxide dismutase
MKTTIAVSAVVLLLVTAMAAKDDKEKDSQTVELKNANGESIGTATLSPTVYVFRTGQSHWHSKGVDIKLNLHSLPPGEHGIHIHRDPVCEGPDFKSAGGHINPEGKQHGLKNPEGPHAGDLPNIKADAKGNVKTTITGQHVSMEQLEAGRALVIHAKADDEMTDPAGNSGERIACGVIKE